MTFLQVCVLGVRLGQTAHLWGPQKYVYSLEVCQPSLKGTDHCPSRALDADKAKVHQDLVSKYWQRS